MICRLRHHLRALAVLAFGLALLAVNPAAAQSAPDAPHLAADSPTAVPFVGSYEMWCTSRNPAPGNRCSSHHSTPAVDFGMEVGTPINAAGDGVVIDTETSCSGPGWCRNGAGNFIAIEHADGRFSRYLHLTAVEVEVGQVVAVGDRIGTSGVTGQSSSAHLHYDEHFPRGTRTPMGVWLGCVDGAVVSYPQAFGHDDWNDVPYGAIVRNDGYDCLTGATPTPTPEPVVIEGTSVFAVAPPEDIVGDVVEVEITVTDDVESFTLPAGGISILPAPDAPATVRIRQHDNGLWAAWSDAVDYDPDATPDGPTCRGLLASTGLTGTPGADVIIGTDGPDVIDGRGGNDIICGLGGDDVIHGGRGADHIRGGDGNDRISGGFGRDTIHGGPGADNIRGGNGPDTILGGAGADELHGTAGNDVIDGGAGSDVVIGGIGHDRLRGGADSDTLEGRNGRDYLGGGNGDDILLGGNGLDRLIGAGGADTFHGGPGTDRCAHDGDLDLLPLLECER